MSAIKPNTKPVAPLVFSPAIIVDTREQAPYTFSSLCGDVKDNERPIRITTVRRGLAQGDYSLDGFEDKVAVERKSKQDCFGTLGQGRLRFERELARLATLTIAAVVVEAEWSEVLGDPPPFSRLVPRTIFRSALAWMMRFPNVHWLMMPGRRIAEQATFRFLEKFWRESQRKASQ